jgi:putative FmdB family regulatory protein
MPIYEYRCAGCRRKVTVLTLRASEQVDPVCEHCGSRQLTRLMSRFAMVRSEDSRLDDLSDPSSLGGLDEGDPKSMARWMRKMGKELGEDAGDDFDEMVNELEAGGDAGEEADGDAGDSSSDEDDL